MNIWLLLMALWMPYELSQAADNPPAGRPGSWSGGCRMRLGVCVPESEHSGFREEPQQTPPPVLILPYYPPAFPHRAPPPQPPTTPSTDYLYGTERIGPAR